jgi:2-polyprenyl-3-methyl-5-hydroxy-6-metoxy-1,4-benzoquinol methylase
MQCPICKSITLVLWAKATDAEYCTTADELFSFYQCRDCLTLVLHPIPNDRLNVIYPKNYYSYAQSPRSIVQRIKLGLDKRWFRKVTWDLQGTDLSALDIGGGAGLQLNVLRSADNRFNNTVVVDIDSTAEEEARRNHHSYFCGGIENYTTEKKYDVILMLNLIEHVESPVDMLKKAASLLSPQGKILLKTPNTDSLDARLFRHHNWGGYHCPRHWVLFTKESLERAIHSAGLNAYSITYTQGAPFWAVSVLFALKRLGLVSITAQRPAAYHPMLGLLTGAFAGFDFIRRYFSKTSQMFAVIKK